jgi:beta-galactosidase
MSEYDSGGFSRRDLFLTGGAALAALSIPVLASGEQAAGGTGRETISLDGIWEVGETLEPNQPPATYGHRAPVPGLTHSATPPFAGVDEFQSRQHIEDLIMWGRLPSSARIASAGISRQPRNYFWYRTHFGAPARRELAVLTVSKAQFGSAVWVNGRLIGEHLSGSTSASYDISRDVRWSSLNEVLIRIGAHPGVLPEGCPCGTDFEKTRWTPGIYDHVSVALTDALAIDVTQVAPKISPREILVQTTLRNTGTAARTIPLGLLVHAWREAPPLATTTRTVRVAGGSSLVVTTRIPLPTAKLWSPEEPNLYVVRIRIPGDEVSTRFGLRELRFDTPTRRAYLNGGVYFLRGSNITLHRFFEDPQSGVLPWDERWVRRLLGEKARGMHWNFIRLCIGAVPQMWLDIADEEGMMFQYEYPIWVLSPSILGAAGLPAHRFDTGELVEDFTRWMRDSWNHPSVALWDASNESEVPALASKVIPAVRGLDLSGRQWENSFDPPSGPDDPVEDHPYLFINNALPGIGPPFDMIQLESSSGAPSFAPAPPTGHAIINNEYGWLWLNRDGSTTPLTERVYATMPYPHSTAAERFETNAYLLAGLTEYWRAFRSFCAVMHFVYLTSSVPDGFTSDNFKDVGTLELQPLFESWVGEAFKPLGVYINFWHRRLRCGDERDFTVMMINDGPAVSRGKLALLLEDGSGEVVSQADVPYAVAPNGQQTYYVRLALTGRAGDYWLKATAGPAGADPGEATTSRRRLTLVAGHLGAKPGASES